MQVAVTLITGPAQPPCFTVLERFAAGKARGNSGFSIHRAGCVLSFPHHGDAPMTDANKALAHHWFDRVWNQGREDAIDELFASHGKSHDFPAPGDVLVGPEDFKKVHRVFHQTFSNLHVTVKQAIADGDHVAIRWVATMKHTGDGLGFPATGRDVSFGGASMICVHDGKIVDGWNHLDFTHVTHELQAAALAVAV
jgi:steroid delta-isomerase-like uncharacterized protein